jgi:hypothetical protein
MNRRASEEVGRHLFLRSRRFSYSQASIEPQLRAREDATHARCRAAPAQWAE